MRQTGVAIIRGVVAAAVAAGAMLAACSSTPPKEEPAGPPPKDVADALLPPLGSAAAAPQPGEQRFDLNVKEVAAQAFFMSLVDGTPYNMVVQPGVGGTVTLNLKNVTIPEVMEYMRDAYGYDFRPTPGGYTVMAEAMQSRVFRLNYLNVKRVGKSRIFVSSGQLTGGTNQSPAGVATPTPAPGGQNAAQTIASSNIETDTDSDFWPDVARSLHAIVPEGGGRNVVIDSDAGLVVVRAMTSELRGVKNYLDSLQGNLTRQVTLEAKILEVQLNEGFQAGINWSLVGHNSHGNTFVGQIGGQKAIDNGVSSIAGQQFTVDPATGVFTPVAPDPTTGALVASPLNTTAIGGAVTAILSFGDFSSVIELLQNQGDVKVLSSPRVSTVNNQKAIIKVGSDEFFVTGVSSNTVTGAATASNRNIQLTPFFSGIALDVTPQIDEQDYVTLHVHPTVSQVTDQTKTLQVDNATETLPLALSNVREADSIVRARSGQIIVIGGLMQESKNDQRQGIPVLSKLPIIGVLFRQTRTSSSKSELVILLKPLVMSSDPMWSEEVDRAEQRARDLEGKQRKWWN